MPRRKSKRNKVPSALLRDQTVKTNFSSSDEEASVKEPSPRRKKRGRPVRGSARESGGTSEISHTEPNSVTQENSVSDNNTSVENTMIEREETPIIGDSDKVTSVGEFQARLASTIDDVASFMRATTRTLAALFSVLSIAQVRELEQVNEDEIKENGMLRDCVNQAKSAVQIRISLYKENLEKRKNINKAISD